MDTIYLDPNTWDLTLDSSANIAKASNPYSLAQDAASAIRTFIGECWYNTKQGLPYFGQVLGQFPPLALVKAKMVSAALTVPDVATAKVFISSFNGREIKGQVQITSVSGAVAAIGF